MDLFNSHFCGDVWGFYYSNYIWCQLIIYFSSVAYIWLRNFLGGKPLSFGGFVHSIQNQHIKKEFYKQYPRIKDQINLPLSERGLLSLICDQLIDMKFLAEDMETRGETTRGETTGDDITRDDTTVPRAMHQDEERISLQEMHQDDEACRWFCLVLYMIENYFK